MKGIVIRILHQMKSDRRTLALMVIAPIIILTLLYFLLSDTDYRPILSVDSTVPVRLVEELKLQNVDVIELDAVISGESADQQLFDHQTDALISMSAEGISIRLLEPDSTRLTQVMNALKQAMSELNPAGTLSVSTIYGSADESMFDSMAYVMLGLLSFFFVFIIAGISFVRERDTGTLERMMISPIRRVSVVGGYTLGFGIFTVLQSVLMIAYSHYILKLDIAGSIPLAMLVMVLLAFSAVSSGALVSIFANNEFQVMQFIPIVVIPQYFFSGMIAIDTLPYGLGKLAYVMPVFYGCSALKEIIIKGYGLGEIGFEMSGLLLINVLLFVLNVFALKKYRQL